MLYTNSRIRAGQLRHRLEIVQPYGPAQDSTGSLALVSMSPVATVWGSIESVSGRDVLAAMQFSSVVTHKITIRFRGAEMTPPLRILAKDQIWFQGPSGNNRAFSILAIMNPDERNKMLVLLCVEINDSAQQQLSAEPGGLK